MFAHRLSLSALRTMAVALLVAILCALAPARAPADEPPPGAWLKTGRFSTGSEFLTSPIDFSFVNEALNPILFAVQVNVARVTADPNVTWGGRVAVRPTPALSLAAGAFYSDPTLNQLTANGTEFGITSAAGYFVVGEIGYLVHAENNAPGLPGRYRVGGYYDSNQYVSLSKPGHQQTGNYGLYVMGEQMVFREGGPGSAEGLSLFGALIYTPTASINPLPGSDRPERAIAGSCRDATGTLGLRPLLWRLQPLPSRADF